MANINETIKNVETLDPELARQIRKYVKEHSYGLVFEKNLPEAVRLYTKTPTVGDTANIRPKRGDSETESNKIPWTLKSITNVNGGEMALIERMGEKKEVQLSDLVTIVSYKDIIYPGLKEVDRIERGNPDDPYQVVINAENYHALCLLNYCYAGKVDCIYIDPPYNTGAKDWKYNNDYVDETDQYRHSKWLAFMERRLKLAKQLLNPEESVLIITIDENEYARLSLLLEQIFSENQIQMITTVINAKGIAKAGKFSRVEEYIFVVTIGNAKITPSQHNMLDKDNELKGNNNIEWLGFRRRERTSVRTARPNQFYPIYVDNLSGRIVKIGDRLTPDIDRNTISAPEGQTILWPLKPDGTEMMWGLTPDAARENLSKGFLRVNNWNQKKRTGTVQYLQGGVIDGIKRGTVEITGKQPDGSILARYKEGENRISPKQVWNVPTHNAENYGTALISSIIGKGKFDFPKSLYAVKDIIKFYLANKKDALIVDFFAGSGTTLQAINLLNTEDGGKRHCVCITNNEISAKEEESFIKDGLRQGDPDWEKFGIAKYVTWPRTKYSILGTDINGEPLKGSYIGTDLKMSAGFKANAIFFDLTYESKWPIRLDQSFNAIAPIIWMQAGSIGPIIEKARKSYSLTDNYGVLFDYGQSSKFCHEVKQRPNIKTVYVVTDDQRRYSSVCRRLPGINVYRLYESFLKTFEICGEGALD